MLLDLARSNRNECHARKLAVESALKAAEHTVTAAGYNVSASQHAMKRDTIHLELLRRELVRTTQALQVANHGIGRVRGFIRKTGLPVRFNVPNVIDEDIHDSLFQDDNDSHSE